MIEALGFFLFFSLSPLPGCLTLAMTWGVLGRGGLQANGHLKWIGWNGELGELYLYVLVRFGVVLFIRLNRGCGVFLPLSDSWVD